MKIYISGSNLSFLTKKKEVLEKRDILKENNHSVVLGCELKNKFLKMYRREPTPEELKSFKREILSECEGIMFLSSWQKDSEVKQDHNYAVEHNLVIFEVFRQVSSWGKSEN